MKVCSTENMQIAERELIVSGTPARTLMKLASAGIAESLMQFFPVPGGSTVVLRAIPLLRMLGFARIHLFGFDSCVSASQHHAYEQPENDSEVTMPVTCGGCTFMCTPWMISQASEFRDLVAFMGDEVELAVHGDGLIAQMIKHGAELAPQE